MKTVRLLLPAEEEMLEAAFYYEQLSSSRSCTCADILPTGSIEHPENIPPFLGVPDSPIPYFVF